MKELVKELNTAFSVIPESLRRKVMVIVAASTVGVFLELLSLGFLISAIKLLIDDKSIMAMSTIGNILVGIANNLNSNVMTIGLIILLILYFLKSIYMTYFLMYQTRFAYDVQERLSSTLFGAYLRMPHKSQHNGSTTTQIRNIITEVPVYVTNVLIYGMQLLSELVPLIGTIGFLLYIDFFGTLYTSLAAISIGVMYYLVTRTRVRGYGLTRQIAEEVRIREINHSLISRREILIYDLFGKCSKRFNDINNRLCQTAYSQSVLQQLPRYWFEFISIFAIVYLAYYLSSTLTKREDLIVILGVFAFGAFKLLPSVNRILLSIQAIRYGMPSAKLLNEELKKSIDYTINGTNLNIDNFQTMEISNLKFKYPDSENNVISGLNFVIKKGEWVAIVGESGSGKTTLLELILGLLKPSEGNIYLNNIEIQNVNLQSFYNLIGYVPQDVFIYDDTIANNITYWDESIDFKELLRAIEISKLKNFIANSPTGVNDILSERGENISGGQKQRIAIARAIYRRSKLIILDEATGSLDKDTENLLLTELKKSYIGEDITLVAITHSIDCLHLFDKVIRMKDK
jgi:ABC-type multidrug transport system fused ATPase/permease subunit